MIGQLALALALVLMQCIAGGYLWQVARRGQAPLLESLGVGLAMGTALAALSGVLLWNWLPVWGWTVPIALAIALAIALKAVRGNVYGNHTNQLAADPEAHAARSRRVDRQSAIALVIALALGGFALLANLRSYPLSWTGMQSNYHPDMLFFEGLSTSLAHFGPFDSIFMVGSEMRYHWLTYAWSGQLSQSIDAQSFLVLTRVLPLTSLVGAVVLSIAWTRRITAYRWAPTIAAVLIVSGGYVGATYGTILNFDSPSQQLATVWLLGLSLALWQLVRGSQESRLALMAPIIVLLGAAATLGKVSTGIAALGAWGFVAVIASIRRERWAVRAWIGLLSAAVGCGVVYLAFIAGPAEGGGLGLGSLLNKASSVQGLNPTDASWGIMLGTGFLLLAMAARWLGLSWLIASPITRWQPLTTYGVGLVLVSVATVLLVSGGLNDTWFALAASAPLSVISSVGIAHALERTVPQMRWLPPWPVAAAVLAGMLVSAVVSWIWTLAPGHDPFLRWAGPLTGFIGAAAIAYLIASIWRAQADGHFWRFTVVLALVTMTVMAGGARLLGVASSSFGVQAEGGLNASEFVPILPFLQARDLTVVTQWSQAQREAGQWLGDHSDAHALVVTNVNYSPLVPALSGRQTLISGIQYQAPYGRAAMLPEVLAREGYSVDFINSPVAPTFARMCQFGVTWAWLDPRRTPTRDWEPFASVTYSAPDVILLKLDPSAC
ncbi:MAG TPA: hypothetical protein DDY88_02200 [Actinobacteria bacterium]|nr:hypothetical protein [Actinomycetota bacterium]